MLLTGFIVMGLVVFLFYKLLEGIKNDATDDCLGTDCRECCNTQLDEEFKNDLEKEVLFLEAGPIFTIDSANIIEPLDHPLWEDFCEFDRIISNDIRVGDCFIELDSDNGYIEGEHVVRMITKIRSNNTLTYEYCNDPSATPYNIDHPEDGISRDDFREEVMAGAMVFVGTFNLEE